MAQPPDIIYLKDQADFVMVNGRCYKKTSGPQGGLDSEYTITDSPLLDQYGNPIPFENCADCAPFQTPTVTKTSDLYCTSDLDAIDAHIAANISANQGVFIGDDHGNPAQTNWMADRIANLGIDVLFTEFHDSEYQILLDNYQNTPAPRFQSAAHCALWLRYDLRKSVWGATGPQSYCEPWQPDIDFQNEWIRVIEACTVAGIKVVALDKSSFSPVSRNYHWLEVIEEYLGENPDHKFVIWAGTGHSVDEPHDTLTGDTYPGIDKLLSEAEPTSYNIISYDFRGPGYVENDTHDTSGGMGLAVEGNPGLQSDLRDGEFYGSGLGLQDTPHPRVKPTGLGPYHELPCIRLCEVSSEKVMVSGGHMVNQKPFSDFNIFINGCSEYGYEFINYDCSFVEKLPSPVCTPTASVSPTLTSWTTPTVSMTPTITKTVMTPTVSATVTPSPTASITPTVSATPTASVTSTVTKSVASTPTVSATPTASVTSTTTKIVSTSLSFIKSHIQDSITSNQGVFLGEFHGTPATSRWIKDNIATLGIDVLFIEHVESDYQYLLDNYANEPNSTRLYGPSYCALWWHLEEIIGDKERASWWNNTCASAWSDPIQFQNEWLHVIEECVAAGIQVIGVDDMSLGTSSADVPARNAHWKDIIMAHLNQSGNEQHKFAIWGGWGHSLEDTSDVRYPGIDQILKTEEAMDVISYDFRKPGYQANDERLGFDQGGTTYYDSNMQIVSTELGAYEVGPCMSLHSALPGQEGYSDFNIFVNLCNQAGTNFVNYDCTAPSQYPFGTSVINSWCTPTRTVMTPTVTKSVVSTPTVTKSVVSTPTVTKSVVSTPTVTKSVVSTPTVTKSVVSTPTVTKSVVSTPTVTASVATTPTVTSIPASICVSITDASEWALETGGSENSRPDANYTWNAAYNRYEQENYDSNTAALSRLIVRSTPDWDYYYDNMALYMGYDSDSPVTADWENGPPDTIGMSVASGICSTPTVTVSLVTTPTVTVSLVTTPTVTKSMLSQLCINGDSGWGYEFIYGAYFHTAPGEWTGTGDGTLGSGRILKMHFDSGHWYIDELDTNDNNNLIGTWANTQPACSSTCPDPTIELWYDMNGNELSCYEGEC